MARSLQTRLDSLLAECEREYLVFKDALSQLLESEDSQPTRFFESAQMFLSSVEAVERVRRAAPLTHQPTLASASAWKRYREEISPKAEQLRTWAAERDDPEPVEKTPLWNLLVTGLDVWQADGTGFSEDTLARADDLICSPFFRPDQWMSNAADLELVVGTNAHQRLPGEMRLRLRELNWSFILGNHLAAIALARSILEYAILDRASSLGIDPRSDTPKYKYKRLWALAEEVEASNCGRGLAAPMSTIREAGNEVVHSDPRKRREKKGLTQHPSSFREPALASIRALVMVLERLYWGQERQDNEVTPRA